MEEMSRLVPGSKSRYMHGAFEMITLATTSLGHQTPVMKRKAKAKASARSGLLHAALHGVLDTVVKCSHQTNNLKHFRTATTRIFVSGFWESKLTSNRLLWG